MKTITLIAHSVTMRFSNRPVHAPFTPPPSNNANHRDSAKNSSFPHFIFQPFSFTQNVLFPALRLFHLTPKTNYLL
jgi:hypothetical protein